MKTPGKLYLLVLALTITLGSCAHSDQHREEGKIFHAAPSSGGIGALYFALYNDKTYQICNSGGLGQDCYSGNFYLQRDTLILMNMNKRIPLKSSRLLIIRYSEQDSGFWNWKFAKSIGVSTWQDFKRLDSAMGGTGDVYQLDNRNEPMKDESHFIIRLDGVKKYR